MNSVTMVVAHVVPHQPEQMSFVQRDDMIQDLSATTSHPAFRDSILPRRLNARPLRFQTRRLQERDDARIEFRITVQYHVTVWASFRKSLAQLLDDPIRTGMSSDVAVQDPAAAMLNDKKAVQQLERQRRHGEEIERDDCLAVILQECQPSLGSVAASVQASQIARDSPFRDDEAELLQLAVDFGRSPVRVLVRQASDQVTYLLGDLLSATSGAGTPMPIDRSRRGAKR